MKNDHQFLRLDVCHSSRDILNKYAQEMRWQRPEDIVISVQDIYDNVIYPEYEFSLVIGDLGEHAGKKVLGKTIHSEKKILIDKTIAFGTSDSSFAFTLAHEIGHAVLHCDEDQYEQYAEMGIHNQYVLNEIHANTFAEFLVAPNILVQYRFMELYGTLQPFLFVGAGEYKVNGNHSYINSFDELAELVAVPLTCYFSNVSKVEMADVLKKSGLVVCPENRRRGLII